MTDEERVSRPTERLRGLEERSGYIDKQLNGSKNLVVKERSLY